MDHNALPKPVKKKLAELVCTAHETALRQELLKLRDDFARWDRGELDSFRLSERIHQYHDGPNREIYKRFTYTSSRDLPMLAASAIRLELVDKQSVPADVLPYLEPWMELLKST